MPRWVGERSGGRVGEWLGEWVHLYACKHICLHVHACGRSVWAAGERGRQAAAQS
jgi:hypothetical protein